MKYFGKITAALLAILLLAGSGLVLLPWRGDISVLMYHFAGNEDDAAKFGNIMTAASFRKQMEHLKRFGYRVISLEQYEAIRRGDREPLGREVVLTFDDGDLTFEKTFYPILKEFEFPATVFMIVNSSEYDRAVSMSLEELKLLSQDPLITIGLHTRTHPHLPETSDAQLEDEIAAARKEMETYFGKPLVYFSYPFGELDERVKQKVASSGYRMAFATSPKKLKGIREDFFSVTRVKMTEKMANPILFLGATSGAYQNAKRFQHWVRQISGRYPKP